jgi:exosortase A-associated hydrolase 1
MEPIEEPIRIPCGDSSMWGIVTHPPVGCVVQPLAVLIVVGGPQYRVGSHRQFVLLARALARRGIAALRFDYRGMGDSAGDLRSFEHVGDDVRAALSSLQACFPTIERHVVWGLCDAAAAAMMYATAEPSVVGIVAANPWVRSDASLGAVRIKHYYVRRLLERELWRKVLRGAFDWRASWRSLLDNLRKMLAPPGEAGVNFQQAMAAGLRRFPGRMLLLISANDLTAREFLQFSRTSPDWRGLLEGPGVMQVDITDADHTFSRRVWCEQAERATIEWTLQLTVTDQSISKEAA